MMNQPTNHSYPLLTSLLGLINHYSPIMLNQIINHHAPVSELSLALIKLDLFVCCEACLEHLHGHAERVPFRRWKAMAKHLGTRSGEC